MKKIISILAILLTLSVSSQTLIKPKQIEGSTAGSILTTTGTGVPTWTTTIPAGSIPTFSTYWSIAGNSITGTPFLGTTNNRTLDFKTNNTKRFSIDSVGILKMGTPTYTDQNIWSFYQGSANGYYQSIWSNTSNSNTASVDLVVSNNLGTKSTYYGNFGMNSSTYTGTSVFNQPNVVYLTSQNGDLAIGTLSNNAINFSTNSSSISALTIDASKYVYARAVSGLSENNAIGLNTMPAALGIHNSAYGDYAANGLINGVDNTLLGRAAAFTPTTMTKCTVIGSGALFSATNATNNVIAGFQAAVNSTSLSQGTILGAGAGLVSFGLNNTFIGYNCAPTNTGSANTVIGANVGLSPAFSNYVAIGNGTGQVVYQDNGTSAYNLRPITIGSTVTPTRTLEVIGTIAGSKIYGNSAAPTVTAGSGLGTGAGTVISVTGNDICGIIGVVTGTASLGTSAVLGYLTWSSAYTTNAPVMSIEPYNIAARNLIKGQEVYPSAATTTFAINTNTVALTASTTYSFSYKALGR